MQPLSWRIRLVYFLCFALLFAALLPLVILYADGWRFSSGIGLYKTGGVYVTVPYTDVVLSINGDVVGRTGILQRNFYIDDLAPSTYVLRAAKDGYYSWERMIVVEPQLVTDSRVLLMPAAIEAIRLTRSGNATGTRAISAELLEEYQALFATALPASSTVPVDAAESVALFVIDGDLYARWMGTGPVPSIFCHQPSRCVSQIALENGNATVLSAQFFGGGVLYRTEEEGVFLTELDVRPTPRAVALYQKSGLDFRVVNGIIVVKDGPVFYEIGGL